ncbi:MAG TPA: ABC transporter substrate-binding protein [Thermomicrobiales bacterium]|nr:ABC transporter substrate-binding protein [Thermomicrobiales bacterium]
MSEHERDDILTRFYDLNLSRRGLLAGTLGVTAAALLAACGGDDDDDDDDGGDEQSGGDEDADAEDTPEPEEEPTATEAPAQPTNTPSQSGAGAVGDFSQVTQFDNPAPGTPTGSKPDELIIVWGANQFATHGIDPQLHVGTIAEAQLRHMYEPLVKFERDLQTISPVLATEWERIDELTMQFKLREGVTFHDGEPFNAETVRYSILRPLSDETPGDARSTYSIISDVEIVDEYTVNIKTSQPDPALLARLTGFHMVMVPPAWIGSDQERLSREGNGTGPYRFVSWSPNEDLVLEANEDYWGGAPSIKRVRLRTITEQATRVSALRAGDVHVIKDVGPEEIDTINAEDGLRVVRAVSNRVPFYFFTTEVEPFDNPLVRQAINYAANVDGVIDAILLGNGERLSTVLGKWVFGFDPTLPPYPHDPEKARELLAEAGYPDGIDVSIWHIQGRYPKDKEVAEAMAGAMAEAGINCTPELRESAVLNELQMAKETPGLVFASWGNWFFDADNTFVPLFGCESAVNYGDWRRPYGCNEEFEAVIQEARTELDVDRRLELYAEAQRILYEDAGALFMYQLVDIFGVNDWVKWEPRHDEMMWAHEMEWNE